MTSRTGKPLLSAPGKVKSLDDFTDLFLQEFLKKAVEAFRKQTKQKKGSIQTEAFNVPF